MNIQGWHSEGARVVEVGRSFVRDVQNHAMEVLHADGLYRHVLFQSPTTSGGWFEFVTWPGKLAISGDCESYTFSRLLDMFEFFRAPSSWNLGSINPGYWAQKLITDDSKVRRYDHDVFVKTVREHVAEAVQHGETPRGVTRAVRELLHGDGFDLHQEDQARRALESFEHKGWRFHDMWEFDFTAWDWHFLWACHAIQWGITQFERRPSVDKQVREVTG